MPVFQSATPTHVHLKTKLPFTIQEQEKMMREVMRHMLFRQKALPDVPVPRNDLTKLVLANSKDTKKGSVGNAIIALAQESFCKVMGIEMRELRIAPVTKGKSKLAGKILQHACCLCLATLISSPLHHLVLQSASASMRCGASMLHLN